MSVSASTAVYVVYLVPGIYRVERSNDRVLKMFVDIPTGAVLQVSTPVSPRSLVARASLCRS